MNERVTVARATEILAHIQDYRRDQTTLAVEVFSPGSIGGTPRAYIVGMQAGFDWDNGVVLLKPSSPLTALTPEQVEAIMESAREGQSWHAYQAQKKLREQIRGLEDERDRFRVALNEWFDKTEWVQKSAQPLELGRHRADVLRERIRELEAEVAALKQGGV